MANFFLFLFFFEIACKLIHQFSKLTIYSIHSYNTINISLFFIFFIFYLKIEIYTTHTHTLFGESRGDSNLCQLGGRDSLAPLGIWPSGRNISLLLYVFTFLPLIHLKITSFFFFFFFFFF